MSNNPLVSVIVPNYNYERFLDKRMQTILEQTYRNIEVLLLDDASTDESVSVMRKWAGQDTRIVSVIVNSDNSGSPFKQWQKGLERARGKYVWIAESDDYCELSFLETLVSLLEQYPEATVCFSGSYLVNQNDEMLEHDIDNWTPKQRANPDGHKYFEGKTYAQRNLFWYNYVYNASGVVFRKATFDALTDREYFNMRYCGDWRFWFDMVLAGGVIEVYKKLNYFRRHSSCVTESAHLYADRYLKAMDECLKYTVYAARCLNVSQLKLLLSGKVYYRLFKNSGYSKETIDKLNEMLQAVIPFSYLKYTICKPFIKMMGYGMGKERCE